MSSRPIISYDDITLPYDAPSEPPLALPDSFTGTATSAANPNPTGPPPKKRKKNHKNKQRNAAHPQKGTNSAHVSQNQSFVGHPPGDASMAESYDPTGEPYEDEEGWDENAEEEESRNLTHDEIWDDSALVNAWDSAMEEYEMFHGPGKDWKNEPVKKSPLWYNIPPKPNAKKSNVVPRSEAPTIGGGAEDEANSQPLNFETFVPTHDPTLELPDASAHKTVVGGMLEDYMPGPASGPMVTQDEAFQRALNAMYWGGYWTAMYHAQRQYTTNTDAKRKSDDLTGPGEGEDTEVDNEEGDEEVGFENGEVDEFVDAQR